jgi:hypothetical protein
MAYENHTIEELQKEGAMGNELALTELGRRVLTFEFCMINKYCSHLAALAELQQALDTEIPDDCPHCGKFISET